MDDLQKLKQKKTLSLVEAAQLAAETTESLHETEVMLAEAIERGELRADIKRWTTEQWEGRQLPGNMNHLETWVDRVDLDAWLENKGLGAVGPGSPLSDQGQ